MPRITVCPTRTDTSAATPDTLAYSLTLPSALTSPTIARTLTRTVLTAHGLTALVDPATQAVAELTAAACTFSATPEVYLSLRFRDGTLRVIAYDSHPRHTRPRLAAACDARRRAALRLLACVTRARGRLGLRRGAGTGRGYADVGDGAVRRGVAYGHR
ncbi:ATP-binding protein [Streptomyces sp. KN37]|uniref:ATP-binding protein n=1 Tax=unclassified Streptomyces TaxID=2593676 RepID=UPI002A750629|nr:ATP-binding protein [Streptomyces sp. KN37]WPO71757.1 ATP-binding protein [Streptomyces sp. KN37]